jgi:ubiquinone/menaquinone biosynthesis C-methylase UbiE
MNSEEYSNLERVEKHHWFYAGKREIVRYWLNQVGPLSPEQILLDCGAGTGLFVKEMLAACKAIALDDHQESLEIAREKLSAAHVVEGLCTQIPFEENSIDAITALDVLEHVEHDHLAIKEFARVLKPGGILIVTVPALPTLWSDWDVALHHYRRYTSKSMLDLVPNSDFTLIHHNYVNFAVLPIVWLLRKIRGLNKSPSETSTTRAEDSIPIKPLNALLKWLFVKLACQKSVQFPAGVGLIGIWRKS